LKLGLNKRRLEASDKAEAAENALQGEEAEEREEEALMVEEPESDLESPVFSPPLSHANSPEKDTQPDDDSAPLTQISLSRLGTEEPINAFTQGGFNANTSMMSTTETILDSSAILDTSSENFFSGHIASHTADMSPFANNDEDKFEGVQMGSHRISSAGIPPQRVTFSDDQSISSPVASNITHAPILNSLFCASPSEPGVIGSDPPGNDLSLSLYLSRPLPCSPSLSLFLPLLLPPYIHIYIYLYI
jgi:hypothetical protein